MKYFIIILLFLSACVQKNEPHKHEHTHTQKLKRPLTIVFLSKEEVSIDVKIDHLESLHLSIYHQIDNSKSLIHEEDLRLEDQTLRFSLDEDFEKLGGVLAAVLVGHDKNQKTISSSASYILGEQEEIDSAKRLILKN